MIFFIFGVEILVLNKKIANIPNMFGSIHVLDSITLILTILTNFLSIFTTNFIYNKNFKLMSRLFDLIERDFLNFYKLTDYYPKKVNIVIILHIVIIIYFLLESFFVLYFLRITSKYFGDILPFYFNVYLLVLTILQYSFIVMRIQIICKLFNKKLSEYISSLITYKNLNNFKLKRIVIQSLQTNFFLKNLDRIYDLVDLTNQIFGVRILFIFGVILLSMVRALHISIALGIIHFAKNNKNPSTIPDFKESLGFVLISLINILGSIVFLVRFFETVIFNNNIVVLVFWINNFWDLCKNTRYYERNYSSFIPIVSEFTF